MTVQATQVTAALQAHSKRRIALRARLGGMGYYQALEAMDFAEGWHAGLRKDGVTPEFAHQVSIVSYLTTLPNLRHPQATLAVGFLHDVCEDYPVPYSEIEGLFGSLISEGVHAMTKTHLGVARPKAEVLAEQAANPIASIGKGADRSNNQQTMAGVFSAPKILDYLEESRNEILPMLKIARRRFPDQEMAYQNVRHLLVSQMELLEAALDGLLGPAVIRFI